MASGRFRPGKSGNPGGRPKDIGRVKELARGHTEEAIATLAAIMRNDKEPSAARVRAAEAMLDRAWGRPETTTNVAGADGGPFEIQVVRYDVNTGVPRADDGPAA